MMPAAIIISVMVKPRSERSRVGIVIVLSSSSR
jgi:hypothetical protein